jgi:cell filamentation protein
MPSAFVDPYIDINHNVLRNKVGATTYDRLRNAEGEFVAFRISEFFETLPIKVSGTLDDLRYLHKALFQDIYDWAGEIRTVEIRKAVDGSEFFLPSRAIVMGIAWANDELKKDQMLKELPLDSFAKRLAYHYDNYNFVHPFREGNGRAQRLLWTLLCHDAGYDLRWQDVTGKENDRASKLAAENRNMDPLIEMFSRISIPCDPNTPINNEFTSNFNLADGLKK